MDNGNSCDNAIDVETDDYVARHTTFCSMEQAKEGLLKKQKKAEKYLAACAKSGSPSAQQSGGRLLKSNIRGRGWQGRARSSLASKDRGNEEDDRKGSPSGKTDDSATQLLVESDEEVQIVAPPLGYTPLKRKRSTKFNVAGPQRVKRGPCQTKPRSQKTRRSSNASESISIDDADVEKLLHTPNLIGQYRPSLALGELPSMAVPVCDLTTLSEQETIAKEAEERRQIQNLLATKQQSNKTPTVSHHDHQDQDTAVGRNNGNPKPRTRRRLAQDIADQPLPRQAFASTRRK